MFDRTSRTPLATGMQTKLFTVYLMIFGDCDNNFVFINALQYKIICILFFLLFLGYKPKNQKKNKNKQKKNKKKQKTNF